MSTLTVPNLKLVFVAGPYSKPYPPYNVRNTTLVSTLLIYAGFAPHNPLLTGYWDMLTPLPYEAWLALDRVALARCDALLRIPGESSGADKEVELFRSLRKPVYFSLDDLLTGEGAPQMSILPNGAASLGKEGISIPELIAQVRRAGIDVSSMFEHHLYKLNGLAA